MYQELYNARAQPLFGSLNLLFRDVAVAIAVVVFLRPRHTMRQIAATRRRDRLLQQIASCDM